MQRRLWRAFMAAGLAIGAGEATALTANEIYAKVSPSVWRVQTYDVDGLPLAFGTGVVIAPDTLITNCHVLAKAKRVAVKRDKTSIDAKLEMWDPQRDVCQLKAPNLGAPTVALGDVSRLQVGQSVFAVGNPKGLDLTMSAGLLSSIRRNDQGQILLLQTSAPISRGSSGGGLFDEEGVLIGLTTLGSVGDAQNLNFAIPVDWIKELPQRHAKLTKPAASTPSTTTVDAAAPGTSAASPEGMSACVGAGKLPAPPMPTDPAVADASRLPHAGDRMREQYRVFLTCPLPRAFAISEGGKWWYAWSTKPADKTMPVDPAERAMLNCERTNSGRCFVYAIDNRLVYAGGTAPAAQPAPAPSAAVREPLELPEPKIRLSNGEAAWKGWVEQDGRRVPMSADAVVSLKRAPFKLLFDVDPKHGIWLAASQSPQLFDDFRNKRKRLGFFLPITVGASKGDGSDRWLSVEEPRVSMLGNVYLVIAFPQADSSGPPIFIDPLLLTLEF